VGYQLLSPGGQDPNLLTVGEEVAPRDLVQLEYPLDSGTCFFSYFTARKTEPITKVQTGINGNAAASLTLARIGLYTASGGTLTLVASTANDTSLWTATGTPYQKTLSATFNKTAGVRYAVCLLAVGTTMPVLECIAVRYQSAGFAPRLQGELAGQSNLPASTPESGLASSYRRFQAILLP
jgi:hypothetical protein